MRPMPRYEPIWIAPRYDPIGDVVHAGYWMRKERVRRTVITTSGHREVLLGRIARARVEGRGVR